MTIRTACITAGAVALALPAFAGQPKNLVPQSLPGRQVQPTRAASYTIVDGRMVLTSDWVQLNGATTRDLYSNAAFDAAEHDNTGGVLGFPTDQAGPGDGCTGSGIAVGSRWFLGTAYTNPFVSADMQTSAAGNGAACEAVSISWYIDVGDAEPDTDLDGFPDSDYFIAIQQFEDMDVVGCTDDGTNFIDGVIYDFSGNQWDPGFYNFSNITLNGSGLFHTMPADGNGGYQVILGVAFDPVTGQITIPTGIDTVTQLGVATQTMLWGTGNNEVPTPQARPGVDVDGQFDDDAPIDGTHDLALECYSYLFGVCPDPLAVSCAFWIKDGGGCPCPGDINGDGQRDINDLTLFLSAFGLPATNCADINGDGVVDISDLTLFLSTFGIAC